MRFRLGSHLQLKTENILRYFRLRSPIDPLRQLVRHECGSLVPGSADLLTPGRKSSLLSHKPKVDDEKNKRRQHKCLRFPFNNIPPRYRFHKKTIEEKTGRKNERRFYSSSSLPQ